METQKIVNLLNSSENKYSKFETKKWYIIDSESKGNYSHENPIKFLTSSLEPSLCDFSVGYILVTGNIVVKKRNNVHTDDIALDAAAQIAFKIVHHLMLVEHESMMYLLIMQILLILQCLCTI